MSEGNNSPNNQDYDLSNIKHLFFCRTQLVGREYLVRILKNGEVHKEAISFEDYRKQRQGLLDTWRTSISGARCFEYPRWGIKKERVILKILGGTLSLLGLFLVATAVIARHNPITSPLFVFVVAMLATFSSAFFYFSSLKRYYDICLLDNKLVIRNSKGERRYCIDDISSCRMDKVSGNSLSFKDGVRIERLERLSYWPILRDYLSDFKA